MKYKILSDRVTFGAAGKTVDVDESAAYVRALVKAGHIEPVPDKPKRSERVTTTYDEGAD